MTNGYRSEVDLVFFLLGEGLNEVGVVVLLIFDHLFVFGDVVVDVSQTHLCLLSLLPDPLRVGQHLVGLELLLDSGQQLETVLGGVVFHVLEEEPVDHAQRQLLEGFHFSKIHHTNYYSTTIRSSNQILSLLRLGLGFPPFFSLFISAKKLALLLYFTLSSFRLFLALWAIAFA